MVNCFSMACLSASSAAITCRVEIMQTDNLHTLTLSFSSSLDKMKTNNMSDTQQVRVMAGEFPNPLAAGSGLGERRG